MLEGMVCSTVTADNLPRIIEGYSMAELEERRTEQTRTLDRVLEKAKTCKDGHCAEHLLNEHRIELLEEAKDTLCRTSKILRDRLGVNSTVIKIAGGIVTLCAIVMLVISGYGWRAMHQFTKDMYLLREADYKDQEAYRRKQQAIDSRQDNLIELIRRDIQRYKNNE